MCTRRENPGLWAYLIAIRPRLLLHNMGYAQNMVMKLRAKDLLRKACIALCGEALQNLGNSANMERNIDGMREETYLGST